MIAAAAEYGQYTADITRTWPVNGRFTSRQKSIYNLVLEPGIYLPDEALGVRIEDDVVVTAAGAEWLPAGAPRRADDVERAMRAGRR